MSLGERSSAGNSAETPRAGAFDRSTALLWILVLAGVLLRLRQYLFARSMWGDECALASNLIDRSFLELLQPLGSNQGAPIGLLYLCKTAILAFGNGEYALRLVPLLAGVLSVFLFYKVARQTLPKGAVAIALCLFAVSKHLVTYSAELKQYGNDATVALLLYWMVFSLDETRLTGARAVLLALVGAVAVWFSHPSIFILAASGIALAVKLLSKKDWRQFTYLSLAGLCWIVSFAGFYVVSLQDLTANDFLVRFWGHTFMPFPPSSVADVRWFVRAFSGIVNNPLGMMLPGLVAFAFLVGCLSMLEEHKHRLIALILPLFFALLASALQSYPFAERFMLFSAPSLILVIAQGADTVRVKATTAHGAIGVVLIGLLLFYPVVSGLHHFVRPRTKIELKPVLAHVSENCREGDLVYLHYRTSKAFRCYSPRYDFKDAQVFAGVFQIGSDRATYEQDLKKLPGRARVWVLVCEFGPIALGEKDIILQILDERGRRVASFRSPGAAAFLYDLTQ